MHWSKFFRHKCKQRYTKLVQVAIMERRMAMREEERQYVTVSNKVRRRERARERKALVAAKIEKAIEKELLDRLKSGAYGDKPINVDEKVWRKVLGKLDEEDEEKERELEEEEEWENEEEEEEEDESDGEVEYVAGEDENDYVSVEELKKWLSGF